MESELMFDTSVIPIDLNGNPKFNTKIHIKFGCCGKTTSELQFFKTERKYVNIYA